ncbi:hypothetical protein KM043_010997 [Ampulex compressa]|nr:hypothetical protein KM043_010997 [Ampulex compressa]
MSIRVVSRVLFVNRCRLSAIRVAAKSVGLPSSAPVGDRFRLECPPRGTFVFDGRPRTLFVGANDAASIKPSRDRFASTLRYRRTALQGVKAAYPNARALLPAEVPFVRAPPGFFNSRKDTALQAKNEVL